MEPGFDGSDVPGAAAAPVHWLAICKWWLPRRLKGYVVSWNNQINHYRQQKGIKKRMGNSRKTRDWPNDRSGKGVFKKGIPHTQMLLPQHFRLVD